MLKVPVTAIHGDYSLLHIMPRIWELWEMFGKIYAARLHPIVPEYVCLLNEGDMWNYDEERTTLLGSDLHLLVLLLAMDLRHTVTVLFCRHRPEVAASMSDSLTQGALNHLDLEFCMVVLLLRLGHR